MEIKRRFYAAILGGIFVMTISLIIRITAYSVLPMSYWIKYESVEPHKQSINIGDPIKFESTREVYRPSLISFTEIIRCDKGVGHGFENVEERQWPKRLVKSGRSDAGVWKFGEAKCPGICILDTTINLHLPFGIIKSQRINTDSFRVVKPQK